MVKHFEDWKRFKPKKFQFLELNSCYSLLRWISKTTKDWEFFFVLHLTVESVHDQLKRDTLPLSREELIGGATRVEISRQNSQGLLSVAWESHLFPTSLQYCTHLNWGLCITGKRVYINSWIQDLSIYYWSFFHGGFHLRERNQIACDDNLLINIVSSFPSSEKFKATDIVFKPIIMLGA